MIIFGSRVTPKGLVLGYQVLYKREGQVINNIAYVLYLYEIIAHSSGREPKMSTKMIIFAQNVLQNPVFQLNFTSLSELD